MPTPTLAERIAEGVAKQQGSPIWFRDAAVMIQRVLDAEPAAGWECEHGHIMGRLKNDALAYPGFLRVCPRRIGTGVCGGSLVKLVRCE